MAATRASELGDALLEAAGVFELVIDSAAGYRASCLAAGFSPGAAEQMAVDYHRLLLRRAATARPRANGTGR